MLSPRDPRHRPAPPRTRTPRPGNAGRSHPGPRARPGDAPVPPAACPACASPPAAPASAAAGGPADRPSTAGMRSCRCCGTPASPPWPAAAPARRPAPAAPRPRHRARRAPGPDRPAGPATPPVTTAHTRPRTKISTSVITMHVTRPPRRVTPQPAQNRPHPRQPERDVNVYAPGWIPGRVAPLRDAQRLAAGRNCEPHPRQHLPGPARPVYRNGTPARLQPRRQTEDIRSLYADVALHEKRGTRRTRRPGACAATQVAAPALARPERPAPSQAALLPLRGRLDSGILRAQAGSRRDQGQGTDVPARSPQARTVRAENFDHPRADAIRSFPRLRHRGPRRRPQARQARTPVDQRPDRAESAGRGLAWHMRALPERR